MYCSACGSALPANLTYCNRCGARVSPVKEDEVAKPVESYSESLVWAIVSVFIAGSGVIIGMMAVMKQVVGFDLNVILTIAFLCFFMMFVVEALFISLLISSKKAAKELTDPVRLKEHATRELVEARPLNLTEPVPSVTEHETRTFEPVYNKQRSNR